MALTIKPDNTRQDIRIYTRQYLESKISTLKEGINFYCLLYDKNYCVSVDDISSVCVGLKSISIGEALRFISNQASCAVKANKACSYFDFVLYFHITSQESTHNYWEQDTLDSNDTLNSTIILSTPRKTTMQEKNIPALLDETAYTLTVQFSANTGAVSGETEYKGKHYPYVTNIPGLKEGDLVVVPVRSESNFSVVRVSAVATEVCVEPNSEYELRWVVAKLDFTYYDALILRNETLDATVAEAYKQNLRKSFKQRILGDLSLEAQTNLTKLLSPVQDSPSAS